jgi:dienelactone hydrolase
MRQRLRALLAWRGPPRAPTVTIVSERPQDGYLERLVEYGNLEHETVRAFLLLPDASEPVPGVVVHHQHHRERHLGKTEVMGRAGDPSQAFAPRLARNGFAVLAPDAVCFEDRRRGATGTEPHAGDDRQHYDEMASRLVRGSLLMALVVADASLALSVLAAQEQVDPQCAGMLGHSMGGHTTLFTAALDERVRFACISGALCGFQARIDAGVGIELAQIIPGILNLVDFDGLLGLIAPRPVLIVSAEDDPYSFDAPATVARARIEYERQHAGDLLFHDRYAGGHPLTQERVEAMLRWAETVARSVRHGP